MIKIAVASMNAHKVKELSQMIDLEGIELVSLRDLGFDGDIVEDGATFEENALIKAKFVCEKYGMPAMADDSGLCVEALGGAPGIYSARYAGEHGDDDANLDLVLEHMEGKTDRRAAFVCCIACVFPDGSEPIVCHGRVDGELLYARDGDGGFGYDPIFYYPPFGKSFGVTSAEQKNTVSHRARALAAFAEALRDRLQNH